jgi:hypothetical protein
MTLTVIQILLSVIAGGGLFFMWRRLAASSVPVAWLVTAGVLIRAIGGQIAFWISYLHLPVVRSLQLGNGFWFFGLDAAAYFQVSAEVARSGPVGILLVNRALSSSFYVQTLATAILLFGAVASTALLLNIAAYLGCCFIALSFGDPKRHRAVVFAIAALSLAPSTVMWSFQAMKDTWFIFLVAAFFAAARLWQQAWSRQNATGSRIWWTLVMIAAMYGISGIRWYFGFITAIACLPFLGLFILRTSPRRVGIAAALGLVPLLFAAMIVGSGPSISPVLRPFRQVNGAHFITAVPQTFFKYLGVARRGFDNSGGTTLIGAGHAISAVDSRLGGHETRVEATRANERPENKSRPALGLPIIETQEPAPVPPVVATQKPGQVPLVQATQKPAPAKAPTAIVARKPAVPAAKTEPAAEARTPVKTLITEAAPEPARVIATWPAEPVRNPRIRIEIPEMARTGTAGIVAMPDSHAARFLAGAVAMIVPRTIAQRLGILDLRGGRGLWLFADFDTIVFDVVGLFFVVAMVGAIRRRERLDPTFWLILTVTVVIGGLLAYTVSNFGTLFRHREMVLLGLLLLPLAALPATNVVADPVPEEMPGLSGDVANAVN